MRLIERRDGFGIVEALVVMGVIGILVAMGGSLAAKFSIRKSVDRITGDISSSIQIAKLKAARQGVEYRTLFASCSEDLVTTGPNCTVCPDYTDYGAGDGTLTIIRERGNSNNGSTNWCVEATTRDKMPSVITLDLSTMDNDPYRYVFNPNGTLGGSSGTLKIKPTSAERGKRCGKVVISPFGRIRVIQGNWIEVPAPGDCKPIK
ncbi:MAG: pilus assembly FimT family protein [Thermodesulfobacteriota bacterium]